MNPLLAKAEALSRAGVAIVVVAILFGTYQFGRHVKTGEVAEQQRQQVEEITRLKEQRQVKADELALANAARRDEAAPREKLITREVTRYVQVTKPADRCNLPGTWRLRHDAAATGVPIAAEAGPVGLDPAAAVEDAAALETLSDNYAAARECFAQLAYWQRRYHLIEQRGQP